MTAKLLYGDITEKIIGAAFEVHNTLGKGLTEKTCPHALAVCLRRIGLAVEEEKE
jgi:GxxExxY protein